MLPRPSGFTRASVAVGIATAQRDPVCQRKRHGALPAHCRTPIEKLSKAPARAALRRAFATPGKHAARAQGPSDRIRESGDFSSSWIQVGDEVQKYVPFHHHTIEYISSTDSPRMDLNPDSSPPPKQRVRRAVHESSPCALHDDASRASIATLAGKLLKTAVTKNN